MKKIRLLLFAICLFTIFLILGCQNVFTFAPFGFAADDPGKMPRAQLLTYSWDVIASGDKAKMTAALSAAVTMATANPTDGDLWYVAGNLALTLSNAARLFTDQSEITANLPASALAYRAAIDVPLLEAAAGAYLNAAMNGHVLNPVDNIFTTIGLLVQTTANDLDQLFILPALNPAQQIFFDSFYVVGISLIGGPGSIWDISFRNVFFPLLP